MHCFCIIWPEQSGHQSPTERREVQSDTDQEFNRYTHHLVLTDTESEEQPKGYTMF